MPYQTYQGSLGPTNLRIWVGVSRFNEFITEQLATGALQVLEKHGCRHENITFVKVPGAWELAIAAKALAPQCDALIALGAIIRGDTPHFEFVAPGGTEGVKPGGFQKGGPICF